VGGARQSISRPRRKPQSINLLAVQILLLEKVVRLRIVEVERGKSGPFK